MSNRSKGSAHGFTLVELLVVVSIIALLISILLPSLKQAREQGKVVKCLAHQSGIAKAAASYSVEQLDWMVGSPGTTGAAMIDRYGPDGQNKSPEAADIPGELVQTWDYAGPLAGTQMGMSLPADRGDRFAVLFDGIFRCPSTRVYSEPYLNDQSIGEVGTFRSQLVSYQTIRWMMLWPRTISSIFSGARWSTSTPPVEDATFEYVFGGQDIPVELAKQYQPRVDRVGHPAEKVFLTEASRFTDVQGDRLTYNYDWRGNVGGAFSTGGPTLDEQFLRDFHFDDPFRRYTYRHRKGGNSVGVVTAYFDGHAGYLSESESRYPDRWWPKGTVILRSEFNRETFRLIRDEMQGTAYTVRR